MSDFHLAQINIAQPLYDMSSEGMSGFANALEAVNAFAEASPGFVWRLKDEEGASATAYDPYGDGTLINMSVWEDVESLQAFVYRTGHTAFLRRKAEWFPKMDKPHMALWWVIAGHTPSIEEGVARLEYLQQHGASAQAFTFGKAFAPSANS